METVENEETIEETIVVILEIAMIEAEATIEAEETIEAEIEETTDNPKDAIDDSVAIETTTAEEEDHHQTNASGVEKQVIGKNNHLRDETREKEWLVGIDTA